jgi:flagellar biosynthetic protein FliP
MILIRLFFISLALLLASQHYVAAEPAVPPLENKATTQTEAKPVRKNMAAPRTVASPKPTGTPLISKPAADRVAQAAQTAAGDLLPRDEARTANVVRIALILTLMAIVPAILLCMTSFVRIVVVLSMIRHGLGMPETPPNQVLVSLAIFLTVFSMFPTLSAVNDQALQPFLAGQLTISEAIDRGTGPARDFMLRQVRDQDIKAVYDIARKPLPARASEVGLMQLIPAFMLNELRVSFRIGFVILLPFVLIDLVVSSILLSLGMLMVPPTTLSLPIKVLMFVLIDGWSLVLQGVLGSFR